MKTPKIPNLTTPTVVVGDREKYYFEWETTYPADKLIALFRAKQSIRVKLTFNQLRMLNTGILTVLTNMGDARRIASSEAVYIEKLVELNIRLAKRLIDLQGSRKKEHWLVLPLGTAIAVHATLLWDWQRIDLRLAIGKIDQALQNYSHILYFDKVQLML